MRMHKFIFKFIDNETPQCWMIEVDIHCGKHKKLEWRIDPEHEGEHLEWMKKHVEWEHNLKKAVCQEIKKLYFVADVNAPGFGDYTLVKKCVKKEGKMVNMDAANMDPRDILLRKIMWHECVIMKFCRGPIPTPQNWTKIFDYPKKHSYHKFNLETDINDPGAIMLRDLNCQCTNIPQDTSRGAEVSRGFEVSRGPGTRMGAEASRQASWGTTQGTPWGIPQGASSVTSRGKHMGMEGGNYGSKWNIHDTKPQWLQKGGNNTDKYYAEKYLSYKDKYLALKGGY